MDRSEEAVPKQILIFALDEPRYALSLSVVERVIRAVEITPLPNVPQLVQGVINLQGRVIPVVDIRPCFGIPRREVNLDDRFIIAHTTTGLLAVVVDSVASIRDLTTQELVTIRQIVTGANYIQGMAKLDGNLILICDLDQFLSLEDVKKLEAALKKISAKAAPGKRSKVDEET